MKKGDPIIAKAILFDFDEFVVSTVAIASLPRQYPARSSAAAANTQEAAV
jgi:hypothetical protein